MIHGVANGARPAGRFAGLPSPAAIGVLVLLAALIALGVALPAPRLSNDLSHGLPAGLATGPAGQGAHAPQSINVPLYSGIIARVRAGQPYETAAVAAQRAGGFPLRPFVTVRPPALAVIMARLPDLATANLLMRLLALAVLVAWTIRLAPAGRRRLWLAWSPLVVFTGVAWAIPGLTFGLFHECWAGLLIALSLALRTDRRFLAAVVVGLLAALIRELAMPYLLVMALLALAERRRVEALAFAVALGISLAALGLHAAAVMSLTTPHDLASPGWVKLGGWPFVMATAQWNLVVVLLSGWAAAATIPLALIGAAGSKNALGVRLTALLVGYTLGFTVIGQPNDFGWGFVVAPLIGVGLALSPLALGDLWRSAVRPQTATLR
jgi:hypothetical protein